ncbi:hypothetical protein AB870_03145 [Pandoraea faecigallinarum]|uniref:Uncharacterized protein n=1 Tax=Pandoraea faecigallinarum TaxID=656179 RepID=A0A0H3WN33_9BURK|nr:hypothetical protein [Pandoraea faecigallinarum]AKM29344.1 hypothetical protein AB870_03145 [Pandoraea faecigallinarum]
MVNKPFVIKNFDCYPFADHVISLMAYFDDYFIYAKSIEPFIDCASIFIVEICIPLIEQQVFRGGKIKGFMQLFQCPLPGGHFADSLLPAEPAMS